MAEVEFEGVEVEIYRSQVDGKIVIAVETGGLAEKDCHDGGIPNIRLFINDEKVEIEPDGSLIEEESIDQYEDWARHPQKEQRDRKD